MENNWTSWPVKQIHTQIHSVKTLWRGTYKWFSSFQKLAELLWIIKLSNWSQKKLCFWHEIGWQLTAQDSFLGTSSEKIKSKTIQYGGLINILTKTLILQICVFVGDFDPQNSLDCMFVKNVGYQNQFSYHFKH